MALANFYDKAAVAASQVLQGIDYSSLAASLESHVVGLSFDDAAVTAPEGKRSIELAINLLARIYPRLSIVPNGSQAGAAVEDLTAIAIAINPAIEIVSDTAATTLFIAVGNAEVEAGVPVVYIGSDGWVARVSTRGPVGSGDTLNPYGAGAAACFGAANIFRMIFASHLPGGDADEAFSMSLLDYIPNAENPLNPPLVPIDLGESYLIGLGAIGNGTVWALAKTHDLSGVLHLVDGETIELSNLQRYVLTTQADEHGSKVAIAAKQFAGTNVQAKPHHQKWGDFLKDAPHWRFDRITVAVDSDNDRRAVQAALPRWVVNAWTQPGDLGVSRHDFLGDDACLMCLYLPQGEGQHLDRIIAEAIGLPDAFMEIRNRLHLNLPTERDFLERAAAAMDVELEQLLRFENEPLTSFYRQAICGGLVLRLGGALGGTAKHQMAAVPLAFQSALAGIMLAAELVAHAGGLRAGPLPVTTKIDLLHPLGTYLSVPAKKAPSGKCICQDADYINVYHAKYGVS